jgi:putative glutamine amidotransferase
MIAFARLLQSIAPALLIALAFACEPHAVGARPPSSAFVSEGTAGSTETPVGGATAAPGEATCACAQKGVPSSSGAESAGSSTASGPTIAYNGPLAGDVGPSMVEARIRAAGGVPLRITPKNQQELAHAHALVLVGGDDINPQRYGERANSKVRLLSPDRETFDFQLIATAAQLQLPVLGICLGAQELWVAARGTLIQDIPSEVGTKVNHRAKEALHPVSFVAGTRLAQIYGANPLDVFSNHHQAVDAQSLPKGFVVSATSKDGVAEAFESSTANPLFVLGVGWHPEKREQERALFERLVAQARAKPNAQPARIH